MGDGAGNLYSHQDYLYRYADLHQTAHLIDRFTFSNSLFFDPERKYNLNSRFSLYNQDGTISFSRLELLEAMMLEIEKLAPEVVKQHREKMFARLEEAGLEEVAEDERVVREIALFADRSDITEELTRLKSHIAQGRELLQSTEPVGRTLDFLCQEFFREINTTGSKSNNLEITRQVVAFKTELERIREQVQNVE